MTVVHLKEVLNVVSTHPLPPKDEQLTCFGQTMSKNIDASD